MPLCCYADHNDLCLIIKLLALVSMQMICQYFQSSSCGSPPSLSVAVVKPRMLWHSVTGLPRLLSKLASKWVRMCVCIYAYSDLNSLNSLQLKGSVKELNMFHKGKSLVKPVTWQNISCCSVLLPEIVMHDAFNVILWTSANICIVVRDDLGWKNRTTRYVCRFLPHHWLYEWFS